jgi:transposase-like protein
MRRKGKSLTPDAPLAPVPSEILDQFVRQGPISHEELDAAVRRFKKAIIERALGGELTHHLGYPAGGAKPDDRTNHRNGTGGKTVLTDDGPLTLDVPRDREGTFEPRLIAKHERRFTGFDDKILALYARGMTVREIQGFLADRYGIEVSPDLISTVTDGIVAEVTAWQSRPLEPMYPVVFFDALRVKIRDEATVRSQAIYLALAVLPDGSRDILGLWIEQTEGAKFWMKVFTDLICCATAWNSPPGKNASRWRRPGGRSTPRRGRTAPAPLWTPLSAVPGASSFRPSSHRGVAPGRL